MRVLGPTGPPGPHPRERADGPAPRGDDAWIEAFRSGARSPSDHLEGVLRRVEAAEPVVRAFVARRSEVWEEAEASGARWRAGRPRSAVDGLTFTVKDSLDVAGCPKRFGSPATSDRPRERDAAVVARLRDAGAVLLGTTTMSELGVEASSRSPLTGITRNPLDPAWSAGGSSGGAAACVAAGMGSMALATDAGGSVRIPAAFTATLGLKLGAGALPDPPPSVMGACSAVGMLARTPSDLARWLPVLVPGGDAAPIGDPLRVRVLDRWGDLRPDDALAALFEDAVARMRGGARCERVAPPEALPDAGTAFGVMLRRGLLASVDALPAGRREDVGEEVARLLERARHDDAAAVAAAERDAAAVRRLLEGWTSDGAILLLPVTRVLPFGAEHAGPPEEPDFVRWAPFAPLANLAGLPALAVPAGRAADGRPGALQLVGAAGTEARLVAIADWISRGCAGAGTSG